MPLARDDLRALAIAKVADAELLFEHRRYSNSYYLFGYGAELALKARIARMFVSETIPDKKFVADIYQHNIQTLLGLSGLGPALAAQENASPVFAANWATVVNWSEQSRYDMIDEFAAAAMRSAMSEGKHGVFEWLQANW